MQPPGRGTGRYELKETLGRGGMGVIYRAWDNLMKREVALKTIHDVQSDAARQLFHREWGLQASITHPNIAEIYDIGDLEMDGQSRPYFVMPLLPGETLGDLIAKASPRLSVERTIGIVIQICRGLQAAHDRGLIHRDLKPSNIFVLADDSVKIIDFGIAHAESSAQTSVRGTLAYMAPELLQMKPASAASDIFSVGVLCYEALTRRRPFEGTTDADISKSILYEQPPALFDLMPTVPLNISRSIHKAMAKQSWHRFATAREFGDTLQKILRGEPITIFDTEKVAPRVEKAARAFEGGEYLVAMEILSELESEGHVEQEITMLRRRVEQAQRQTGVQQLLESARRFDEDEEFSLALRKVQEALDLDPENRDAQALRNHIEKRRRSRKVEEWSQLARKHLDNNAFDHARSALNSLLELRPGDAGAMALMAELERREQSFESLRKEKGKIYESARQAWERGEVTSALTHLEKWMEVEKQAPETQGERLLALQSFYKKVRQEHETIKKSYEQARQHLSQSEFAQALEICNQYLAKYPGHALYQALKYDVEEKKRQHLSSFIAETDNTVDREPDLDKCVAILEEAIASYPGEAHFESALKLYRDKRNLVSSVVSKARLHEDEGRFGEALDQWEILRAIHPVHPALDLEIERVRKRKEAQSRQDAKAQWVQRIDGFMEARDYERATEEAGRALAEFPGDAELDQVSAIALEKKGKLAEAMKLLESGRSLTEEGNHQQAIAEIRQAASLDQGNPAIHNALAAALAAHASHLAEQKSDQADKALADLLDVDPNNTIGLNLRALRTDRKKEEFITWCTAQARKLQAAGDLGGAIAIVQQGLMTYPNEVRLNQLLNQIEKTAKESEPKPDRAKDVEQLRTLLELASRLPDGAAHSRIEPEAAAIEARRQGDEEIRTLLAEIRHKLALAAAHPQETRAFVPGESHAVPGPLDPKSPDAPPPPPVTPPPATPPPAQPAPKKGLPKTIPPVKAMPKQLRYGLIAAAVVIVMLSALALWRGTYSSSGPLVQVEIRTTPPGATIVVGSEVKGVSNLTLELPPGNYQITADLEGFEPIVAPIGVQAGTPTGVALTLNPWRPSVRVYSEIEISQASLADKPMNPGAPGEYSADSLEDGAFDLRVAGKSGEATASLGLSGKSMPLLTAPLKVRALDLLLVHLFRDRLVVYSSNPASQVSLNGGQTKPVPAEGASFSGVPPGSHQITVQDATTARTVTVSATGGAPVVQAFILGKAEAGAGSILIATGEDQASVKINGYAHWLKSRNGSVRVSALKPGMYTVEVLKDGFESPPPVKVEVKAGEEARIEMKLRQVVKLASLRIAGPAGVQVVIDGSPAGLIPQNGIFTTELTPGTHTFELRRGSTHSASISRTLRPSEVLALGSELSFPQQVTGVVNFDISPSGASVNLRRRGEPESAARAVSSDSVTLPEGAYLANVTAPGHTPSIVSFQVSAGATIHVPVSLRPLEQAKERKPPRGIADFEDISDWSADGAWRVRRGGNYVVYKATPVSGTIHFSLKVRHGRRAQWFVNYKDSKNHVLFRLEDKHLIRVSVVDGRSNETGRIEHKLADPSEFEVRIIVDGARVRHDMRRNGNWATIDQWQNPSGDLTPGKFGFLVPGNMLGRADEYGVKDFSFQPEDDR